MITINPYLRSSVYKALSSLHAYPEASLCREIGSRKEELINLFGELSKQKPFFSLPTLEGIVASVKELPIEELQTEYVRLFDYNPLCSCYETSYADPENRKPAQIISALIEFYNEFGLNVSASFQEPPDCITHELEFMHFLSHMEGESGHRGDEKNRGYVIRAEKMFLEDHLLSWMPKFGTCVKKNSKLSFFQNLSELTETFVTLDHTYVCALETP